MRYAIAVLILLIFQVTLCAAVETSTLPPRGVEFIFGQKSSFQHWSQTIQATGSVIREGAGSAYYGPCPPSGTHRYQIKVTALDEAKKPLAYGAKTVVTGR